MWIGLREHIEGTFRWVDDYFTSWVNWNTMELNGIEECVVRKIDGMWEYAPCDDTSHQHYFYCETRIGSFTSQQDDKLILLFNSEPNGVLQ